ncbi:MAG TPA: NAD-binding protein [candidate division Zixibacteria bacterium]|nr:NAD-binding protein [candidate division Zixibacteria bacterium]
MRNPRDLLDLIIYTPFYIVKSVWIQLSILGSMFVFGALIFMYYQGLDLLTALLGSVSTITTIGIYNPGILSMPAPEKALLIVVFILSVGSAASLVQGTFTVALKSELRTEILTMRKARRLKNHVIVVGYKFLGKYVVDDLKSLGLEFVVIAKDNDQMELLRKEGITAVAGQPTHIYETLKTAGVEKAAYLISTFDDDGDNMLAVLSAKKLNKNIRAISIVNDKDLVESAKAAGSDTVAPIYDIIGRMLASSTISNEVAGIVLSEKLKSKYVVGFEITAQGIKYGDVDRGDPILLVYRNGEIIHDMTADFELQKGDFLYILADNQSAASFKKRLESLITHAR